MSKIRIFVFISFLILASFLKSFSQTPTIYSVCGEGKNVNWPKIKIEIEKEEKAQGGGPGFFYNNCDQGVTPIRASSTLPNQGKYNYAIKNINDDNPMTAWVEGNADYGIGEFFEIKSMGVNAIYNGYQSSPKSWIENSRVKKFKVYKNNRFLCILQLTDEMGRQTFELPGHNNLESESEHVFKFEILEVYPGSKWKDVAISEINLGLCCVSGSTLVKTSNNYLSVDQLAKDSLVLSIDLESGKSSKSRVLSLSKQRHLSMFRVICETSELELTGQHPLFIRNFGFCSISRFMQLNGILRPEDLIGKIEFAIWDDTLSGIKFEKLKHIELCNGVFETFTISKLMQGDNFISNGFISKVY